MRLETRGARKALVVAVLGCATVIAAAGQQKVQSSARTVAAKKAGRAEIDAHAAEWLKESETVNGEKILDHDGSDWGVKTFVMWVPARGIGVVVFTNGENGEAVIKKVVEALYPNKPYVATM